ncbi:MAG: diguanylate cyclase [Armatimonadetes bacterium]|nr:diguanylate cyclase [Armatimonadota bacterium]
MPLPQDRLTKLIHEDELEEQLAYEMERARRYEWDLGMVLVEPVLPDTVGQDMLYAALKKLAIVCSSTMRVVDRGIRWGSGIFYILPETPPEGVEVAARKIQEQFEDTYLDHPVSGEPFKCTVRKATRVYSGKAAKENPAGEVDRKELLHQLRDDMG